LTLNLPSDHVTYDIREQLNQDMHRIPPSRPAVTCHRDRLR
jgi:hypothetical protein